MSVHLRDYQQTLVGGVRDAFRHHQRVLAVSPTGSGKTVVFAYITSHAAAKGNRVFIIAHRTEIVAQISESLDQIGVRHGRVQPGHIMTDNLVQVAMIQTLSRRADKIADPDFLIFDEAHHCASETYKAVCERWPGVKILGVTATPQRLDGRGLGRMFEVLVEGPVAADLIQAGWLANYSYFAPPTKIDLSAVGTSMGDYKIDEMAAAVDKLIITGDSIAHYRDHIYPRSAIVFAVRVDHAEHVAAQFLEAGISAASVDGTMDRATRRERITGLADGRYKVLTSCALISEGLDVPGVGGVILLRPTKSLSMHLQQIGRAIRPKPDGSRAVILDHVGNIHRHGLPDAPRKWALDDRKKKETAPPVSQCEVCFRVFASYPGWKKDVLKNISDGTEADCDEPEDTECLLRQSSGGGAQSIEQVDGKLSEVTTTPGWAGGLDILTARGNDWYKLMERADTIDKLYQIRSARGYDKRWARHVMASREKKTA